MIELEKNSSLIDILDVLAERDNFKRQDIIEIICDSFFESNKKQIHFEEEKKAFYYIDNDEKKYDLENIDNINYESFRKILDRKMEEKRKNIRNNFFFKKEEGKIVEGIINSFSLKKSFNSKKKISLVDECSVVVDLGDSCFGYWNIYKPRDHLIEFVKHYSKPENKTKLKFLLKNVDSDIILARKEDDEFIRKIFALYVPEIKDKKISIVEINKFLWGSVKKSVEKVKVFLNNSREYRTNPTGACIGRREESRISSIEQDMKDSLDDRKQYISIIYLDPNYTDKEKLFQLIFPFKALSVYDIDNENSDSVRVTLPIYQKRFFFSINEKNDFFSKLAKEVLNKKIILSLEDVSSANNVVIWNGNIKPDEYKVNLDKYLKLKEGKK